MQSDSWTPRQVVLPSVYDSTKIVVSLEEKFYGDSFCAVLLHEMPLISWWVWHWLWDQIQWESQVLWGVTAWNLDCTNWIKRWYPFWIRRTMFMKLIFSVNAVGCHFRFIRLICEESTVQIWWCCMFFRPEQH